MRYFIETIPFSKTFNTGSLLAREVVAVYAQEFAPVPLEENHGISEVTDSLYFKIRSSFEENAGRPLADIVKNDTFHDIPYDGTLSLYERYEKAQEENQEETEEES